MEIKNTSQKVHRRLLPAALAVIGTPLVLFMAGVFVKGLAVREYRIESPKVREPFRLVLLSDLHSARFGENQLELIEAVRDAEPDLIMITGDFFVEHLPNDAAIEAIKGVGVIAPCYFVAGNHEYRGHDIVNIKRLVRICGAEVLEGDCREALVKGNKVFVCGTDDAWIGNDAFNKQLDVLGSLEKDGYSILLSHRSELVEVYRKLGFDLVLSGHAHGGHWRIPGLVNGLYAPDQGWFPKYTGGVYTYENTAHVISRGLVNNNSIPRIYNPPEIVVVDITPA